MIEFAAVTYGLLTSFVLSCLTQHQRQRRPSPTMMVAIGYFLCGMSAIIAAVLAGVALSQAVGGTLPIG